jgi:hypothetical protein
LVGLYRSPKVQRVVFIILIAVGIIRESHFYSVLPAYKAQVIQDMSDWQGWDQKAKQPERFEFANRFIIIANQEHDHREVKPENLKKGDIVSSISGSALPVFDFYRKF